MLVIIPNPNQSLELVKLQKKIIEDFSGMQKKSEADSESSAKKSSDNSVLYQASPLWIFLSEHKEYELQELKLLCKKIKSLTLSSPEADENGNYFCTSELATSDGAISGKIILCKTTGIFHETKKNCQRISSSLYESLKMNFPVNLKVFRLANAVQPDELSYSVTASVWCKIK